MKNKWYIIALLSILAILGISLDKASVPNQEIVIQFTDTTVTEIETQEAISLVKSELEGIAAGNIKIQEVGNGTLKITYYSDVTISEIKKIFSQGVTPDATSSAPEEDRSQFPTEENEKRFYLDVYEIQDVQNLIAASGIVLELKSETTRFFTPDTYAFLGNLNSKEKTNTEKVAYATHKNISIALDNAFYKIPEVRAGPLS